MQKASDAKLIAKNKQREEKIDPEDYAKLFKLMFRQQSGIISRVGDSHICFYARKPKACKRCLLLFGAHCHWGLRTSIQGTKISPKDKKGVCLPFKMRGYTLTEEQIEKHIESLSALVNDDIDRA